MGAWKVEMEGWMWLVERVWSAVVFGYLVAHSLV